MLENIPLYEVTVSRKRPRKEVRLQVTLEGDYSSWVSDKRWKRVPDTCPCISCNMKGTVADCHSTGWWNHQHRRGCFTLLSMGYHAISLSCASSSISIHRGWATKLSVECWCWWFHWYKWFARDLKNWLSLSPPLSLDAAESRVIWQCDISSSNLPWNEWLIIHIVLCFLSVLGYCRQRADKGWAFPFSALTTLVGRQEGHPACKTVGVRMLLVMIWLELCTSYSFSCHLHLRHPSTSTSVILRSDKLQNGEILRLAYPGGPGSDLLAYPGCPGSDLWNKSRMLSFCLYRCCCCPVRAPRL